MTSRKDTGRETRKMDKRKSTQDMSDREIAEETLNGIRAILDVFAALGSHPMAAAMMPPQAREALTRQ